MDQLYAYVKVAYTSMSLPQLGGSDHNLVLLTACYVPLVRMLPVTTKTVRTWSEYCYEELQGCFEVTDWNVLCEPHGEDTDGLTECITDYISFCVGGIVPAGTVRYYSNNGSWVTKDILNQKKRAFRGGNREELRDIQGTSTQKHSFAKMHMYCIVLADHPHGS